MHYNHAGVACYSGDYWCVRGVEVVPASMTADITTAGFIAMGRKGEREVIHSGHFMVSDFEADAQDDEENVLLEIPGDIMEESGLPSVQGHDPQQHHQGVITYAKKSRVETVGIDSSLTKLFNAMSIAYR